VTEDRTRSAADRQVASPTDRATCRQAGVIVFEALTVLGVCAMIACALYLVI